jgi:hypothetical protein
MLFYTLELAILRSRSRIILVVAEPRDTASDQTAPAKIMFNNINRFFKMATSKKVHHVQYRYIPHIFNNLHQLESGIKK